MYQDTFSYDDHHYNYVNMQKYTNPIAQDNTASPDNMATQSSPFLVLLKKQK